MKNTKYLKAQLRCGESKVFLLASLKHKCNYKESDLLAGSGLSCSQYV